MRAIRGATQVDADERELILEATAELIGTVLNHNDLLADDLISVLFTTTPDLTAEFPAFAARKVGLEDVPLLCASEIDVPGAMPRVIRLLAYAEIDRPRHLMRHVYLRGAARLRPDIAPWPPGGRGIGEKHT
jgi:chorismate mutase